MPRRIRRTEPEPPAAPGSFGTPGASFTDTTVSDFGAGTLDPNAYVSLTEDGEVILKPSEGQEFSGGPGLPSGWSSATWESEGGGAGGSATVSGGSLHVDGAMSGTTSAFGAGRSLEFVATFGAAAFQHVAFTDNFQSVWAMFSTRLSTSGQLYASTNTGTTIDTPVGTPGQYVGSAHRYRIQWEPGEVKYFIDGSLVHTDSASFATNLNVAASDFNSGGPELSVAWLHLSPYPSTATFNSRVFDAGQAVDWDGIDWNASTPTGTGVAVSVRTGETPTPDGSWGAFTTIPTSGGDIPGTSRYVQYRAVLSSSDASVTPALNEVTVNGTELPARSRRSDDHRNPAHQPLEPEQPEGGRDRGLRLADPGQDLRERDLQRHRDRNGDRRRIHRPRNRSDSSQRFRDLSERKGDRRRWRIGLLRRHRLPRGLDPARHPDHQPPNHPLEQQRRLLQLLGHRQRLGRGLVPMSARRRSFAACTSPKKYSGSPTAPTPSKSGQLTPQAMQTRNPASSTWTIDSGAPHPIDSGPPALTNSSSTSFTFSGTDIGGSGVASFQCRARRRRLRSLHHTTGLFGTRRRLPYLRSPGGRPGRERRCEPRELDLEYRHHNTDNLDRLWAAVAERLCLGELHLLRHRHRRFGRGVVPMSPTTALPSLPAPALRPIRGSPTAPIPSKPARSTRRAMSDATPASSTWTVDTTAPDTSSDRPGRPTSSTAPPSASRAATAARASPRSNAGSTPPILRRLHLARRPTAASPTAPTPSKSGPSDRPATSTHGPASSTWTIDTSAPPHPR